MSALSHLGQMDLGVELVEDDELLVGHPLGRVDPEQVDGERRDLLRPGLGDAPVDERPGPAEGRVDPLGPTVRRVAVLLEVDRARNRGGRKPRPARASSS